MDKVTMAARLLLGLLFVVFGLNGFFQFLETPPMPEQAGGFIGIMAGSGYFGVVKGLEVISGVLFLVNRKVPLGLFLLGPVLVNILLFHIFLAPAGLPVPVVAAVLYGLTAWPYKDRFALLLQD